MMNIYKSDEEVFLLIKAFEEKTLPKAEWTHAAHLTVGLYYCLNAPFSVAKNLLRERIFRLNEAHGTPNTDSSGYHETITIFWMITVADFLAKNDRKKGLAGLANDLTASFSDSNLPLKFYSRELLFSAKARACFIEPNLQNFLATSVETAETA